MAKNELKTVNEEKSLMTDQIPEYLRDKTTSRGAENVGSDDLVIPRLELVQDLSPCRKKTDPSYIVGCEEGMMYNNVTRELYGASALVIPVYFRKEWLIWVDRDNGGGFRGAFPTEAEATAAMALLEDADNCEVIDTAQHFCLIVPEHGGKVEEVVVSMSKSKMKASRKWNSLIRINGGDSFGRIYRLSAVMQSNSKNQDYYSFDVAAAGFPTEEVYKRAEDLYNTISAGGVQVDRKFESAESGESAGSKQEY
jgi:hypothetical protein